MSSYALPLPPNVELTFLAFYEKVLLRRRQSGKKLASMTQRVDVAMYLLETCLIKY